MSPIAYTTPSTSVAGTALTAAFLNTYVRDNVAWLATDSPACRAYNNASLSHTSSGNWVATTFNSERFDNAAMHSTSSNTDRITIPTGGAGKYVIGAGILHQAAAGGFERDSAIWRNGSAVVTRVNDIQSVNLHQIQALMSATSAAAADYFTCNTYQDSGGTTTIQVQAEYSPEFFAFWFRT